MKHRNKYGTKHHKKVGDRYTRDHVRLAEIELDESDYAGITQIRPPWRKRWLDDDFHFRRLTDNEGWDSDRINEIKQTRRPIASRNRVYRKEWVFEEDDEKNRSGGD